MLLAEQKDDDEVHAQVDEYQKQTVGRKKFTSWQFAATQMVKPFADAAFALKKGEMTKTPVQTQFGFHVILVEDTKAAEKASFEMVKPQIENGLKMEKFRVQVAEKAKALRSKAKVTINK